MTFGFILNPCQDENVPTYATTKELKKMSLRINSQNIRQEIGIQVAFIMGKKLQKEHFLVKNAVISVTFGFILNPCQNGNVHTYATTKEMKTMAIRINSRNIKQTIGIQVTFITEKKLQKELLLAKKHCLLADLCVHFELLLGWECTYVCHD